MIRIDTIWLATEPMDMRAGTDTAFVSDRAQMLTLRPFILRLMTFFWASSLISRRMPFICPRWPSADLSY